MSKGKRYTEEFKIEAVKQTTERGYSVADGSNKEAYKTKDDAKKRAKIIRDERGINLVVYQCIHSGGWHLTKG